MFKGFLKGIMELKGEQGVSDEISIVEDESIRLSPHLKQSLNSFDVNNISELRQAKPEVLHKLLSYSAAALEVFERRISRISDAYVKLDNFTYGTNPGLIDTMFQSANKKLTQPMRDRLDTQLEHALSAFDEDFNSVESVLRVIPNKYAHSSILFTMSEYISDGEVDSWEGCIKSFKDDSKHSQMMTKLDTQIAIAQNIERYTASMAKDMKAIKFFTGLTAWNTL